MSRSASGLILLFEPGHRPSQPAIRAALGNLPRASISFDPAGEPFSCGTAGGPTQEDNLQDWLEILIDGMTFDLVGLAPGPSSSLPEIAYRYGFECDLDPTGLEPLALAVGPHLAEGAHALPIVRAMLGLGAELTQVLPGVQAICWAPARTAISPRFFARSVGRWLEGGAFPALGLLGLAFFEDTLRSEGFDFFTGCEIEVDRALCADRAEATRLAIRVAHELVGTPLPTERIEFVADGSPALVFQPDPGAGLVRIEPM